MVGLEPRVRRGRDRGGMAAQASVAWEAVLGTSRSVTILRTRIHLRVGWYDGVQRRRCGRR